MPEAGGIDEQPDPAAETTEERERKSMGDIMGGGMGGMGLWMLFWALVGLTVLVLAVVGITWLLRRTDSPRPGHPVHGETPEELLRRRYAAGEIDEDEYQRRRSGLS
ncbi:hypothetical protein BH24ACT8_BH24ACT8_04940 [soil metagenome]